jgi:hypothetical protein
MTHFFQCLPWMIDWLIDWCLTSSEQFFSYIQDEEYHEWTSSLEYTIYYKTKFSPILSVFKITSWSKYFQSSQWLNFIMTIHTNFLSIVVLNKFKIFWLFGHRRNRFDLIWFLVFNATFSNISAILWRPVLVVEESGVPRENHRPW